MNSWIKHIGLCLVIYLVITIVCCSPSNKERDKFENNTSETIGSSNEQVNLEIDFLSNKNIKAFEQRAAQKLEDLKDYFEILSDPKVDTSFKNQAMLMAMELFANKENTIAFSLNENQGNAAQKVESFFKSLQNNTYGRLSLEIHNISVVNKIEQLNDTEYEGGIKFILLMHSKQKNIPKLPDKIDMQCEIIVKKVQKHFGTESKQIWEVFLGNIFQNP